ncbi:hypothetical protein DL93DRAFT_2167628 [Clavulina sp. PMI_390]|nr:hypothetical protein DL93DRAFT_2167628 [Clavulina sp. PMI_390]
MPNKPSASRLEMLPFDVFLRVVLLGNLDVASLVRLALVSKLLSVSILQNRSLWLAFVRKQLYNELIPEHFMHLLEMDLQALVRLGTQSYGKRADGQERFCTRDLGGSMVLPGGRYLFGIIRGWSEALACCWDLQASPRDDGNLIPVASLLLPTLRDCGWIPVTHPSGFSLQDGTFPFVIGIYSGGLQVFQLQLSSVDQPSFKLSATLHSENCSAISIVGDWVLFEHAPTVNSIHVWNWKRNTLLVNPSDSPANSSALGLCYSLTASGFVVSLLPSHNKEDEFGCSSWRNSCAEQEILPPAKDANPLPSSPPSSLLPHIPESDTLNPASNVVLSVSGSTIPSSLDTPVFLSRWLSYGKPFLQFAHETLLNVEIKAYHPYMGEYEFPLVERYVSSVASDGVATKVFRSGDLMDKRGALDERLVGLWSWTRPSPSRQASRPLKAARKLVSLWSTKRAVSGIPTMSSSSKSTSTNH